MNVYSEALKWDTRDNTINWKSCLIKIKLPQGYYLTEPKTYISGEVFFFNANLGFKPYRYQERRLNAAIALAMYSKYNKYQEKGTETSICTNNVDFVCFCR